MTGTTLGLLLLAHLVGDYIAQSHWMATRKTSAWVPAIAHGLAYTTCHLVVTRSWLALLIIGGTHVVIDRYRLARHLVWIKNHLAPRSGQPRPWAECSATGYDPEVPGWLAVNLMIVCDNTLHLVINFSAVLLVGTWLA